MGKRINKFLLNTSKKRLNKYYDFKIISESKIPDSGIIFSNHKMLFDPVAIGVGLANEIKKQKTTIDDVACIPHFFAKEELWKNPILAYLVNSLEQIPTNRDPKDRDELERDMARYGKSIDEYLLRESYIGYFYSGTRNNNLELEDGLKKEITESKKGLMFMLNNDMGPKKHFEKIKLIPTLSYFPKIDPNELSKSQFKENLDIFGYLLGFKNPPRIKQEATVAFGEPIELNLPVGKKEYKEANSHLIEKIFDMKRQYID